MEISSCSSGRGNDRYISLNHARALSSSQKPQQSPTMQQTMTSCIPPRYNILWTSDQLRAVADAFFADLKVSPSKVVLRHFSTTEVVVFDHSPRFSYNSTLFGLNAVRSYLDLLATHWTCHDLRKHQMDVSLDARRVVAKASVIWKWKKSGRSWQEDFTCTLDFDETMKIKSFVIKTDSAPETCVMRAVDP